MSSSPIRIVVKGPPVGKGSVRFSKDGHPYTDAKSRAWMRLVSQVASWNRPHEPFSGAVELAIVAYFQADEKPLWRRQAQLNGMIFPTKKPDASNIAKGVEDALTRVIWTDDCLVISLGCAKRYAVEPRVDIEVWQIYQPTSKKEYLRLLALRGEK